MANFLQGLERSLLFSSPKRAFRMSGWGRHSSPNALPTATEKSHTNSQLYWLSRLQGRENKWCANEYLPLASNAAIVVSSCLHTSEFAQASTAYTWDTLCTHLHLVYALNCSFNIYCPAFQVISYEYLQGWHRRGLAQPLRWSVQSHKMVQTSSLPRQCSLSCQLPPQSENTWRVPEQVSCLGKVQNWSCMHDNHA